MEVKNKWNGGTYKVLKMEENKVTLERTDGTAFSIAKKEFYSNYFEKTSKK